MIERLSKAMIEALQLWSQDLVDSIENFFSHEKNKWLVTAWNLQSIKTFLNLQTKLVLQEWWQFFLKQASSFLQQLLQTRKHPEFVLTSPTGPSCARALPKLPLILQSKQLIVFWKPESF